MYLKRMPLLRKLTSSSVVVLKQMCLLRDLALALSACLYQALCTSDAWSLQEQQQQQRGTVGPLARLAVVFRAMHNIAGVASHAKSDEADLQATSCPSKWPGIVYFCPT